MQYIPEKDETTNTHTCENCYWLDNTGACAISTTSECVSHEKWYPINDER